MTDLHDAHDLENLYGPLYRFSDHKRGEHIQYRERGINQTGIIRWVCAPRPVSEGGKPRRMHYIVENDNEAWPDMVFPSHIVEDVEMPEHDILRGDEVVFFDVHHTRLRGRALRDLQPGQEQVDVESLEKRGLIIAVRLADIVSVRRFNHGEGTQSWEQEF